MFKFIYENTTDSILSEFKTTIDKLLALSESKLEEAEIARKRSVAAGEEASKAGRAAAKLKTLFE